MSLHIPDEDLIRARKLSDDISSISSEFLDTTCYFITATAFDTLLQCTTSPSPTRGCSSSPPRSEALWQSNTHFFTGSLVCCDPPLVLVTGSSTVSVLERDWENYYVLLDLHNVASYGRLPSLFSKVSRLHAFSKGYPLGSFGEISWLTFEIDAFRNHVPARGKPRTRWRSNSLPSPQTPEESYSPPELNPSLSVCFDLNQASQTPVPVPPRSSPTTTTTASSFFRQAPQRSIHSLVRARLSCLFSSTSSCIVTVRLYFGSTTSSHCHNSPWAIDEGLMIAINDGVMSDEDSWLLGGHGQTRLLPDKEYNFTLVSGLVGDGIYNTPAAIFRRIRLIRRRLAWSARDLDTIWPQAYVEIQDQTDPRIAFSLGPVAFEVSGMRGREWVGVIPPCIEC